MIASGPVHAAVFQPPSTSVDEALTTLAVSHKREAMTGYHATSELLPGNNGPRLAEIYGGPIDRTLLETHRTAYQKEGSLPDAEWVRFWMELSDAEICAMIRPGPERALVPNYREGHPLHQGNIRSLLPIWGKPNHFYAPADGSMWGPGMTVKNPATGQDVTIEDDGSGWRPPEGFPNRSPFRFRAAYRSYLLRRLIFYPYVGNHGFPFSDKEIHASPIYAIAYAYAVTGEQRYADRALLILGRVADIYRHGISLHDTGNNLSHYSGRAYLDDHNFECAMLHHLVLAYDLVWPGIDNADAVIAASNREREPFFAPLSSTAALREHIEKNLFGYAWEFLDRATNVAYGNMQMRQMTAKAQFALVFQSWRMLRKTLSGPTGFNDLAINAWYRDGTYYEDTSAYMRHSNRLLINLATMVRSFSEASRPLLSPEVEALYERVNRWGEEWTANGRDPGVGDSGNPTEPVRPQGPAQQTALAHEVGWSFLRSGEEPEAQRHALFYFGNAGMGHGHRHQLMFKLFWKGYDWSADLGYPANLRAAKREWTNATLSHPTVVVDGDSQQVASTASLGLWGRGEGFQVVSGASRNAYPKAPLYHRTVIALEATPERTLYVDLFRVHGGTQHDYAFHSFSGETGDQFAITLQDQPWKRASGPMAGGHYGEPGHGGYSWLRDAAQTAAPSAPFTATWKPKADGGPGYQLHVLPFSGEVILAKGEREGVIHRSPWDRYLLLRRTGSPSLVSLFAVVHEPFEGEPLGVTVLPVKSGADGKSAALEVHTRTGNRWLIRSELGERVPGEAPMWMEKLTLRHLRGEALAGEWEVRKEAGGEVLELSEDGRSVVLSGVAPPDVGSVLWFHHPRYSRAATFEVERAEPAGEGRWKVRLTQSALLARGMVLESRMKEKCVIIPWLIQKQENTFAGKRVTFLTPSGDQAARLERLESDPPQQADRRQRLILEQPIPDAGASRYRIWEIGPGDRWFHHLTRKTH